VLRKTLVAAIMTVACGWAMAQSYPARPVTLVVGFPPAGGADTVARAVGERFGKVLGQSVLVDNKPGAGSTLAPAHVAHTPADGYTLLLALASMYGSDQLLYKSAQYDGDKDFTPISLWASGPLLLAVRKDLGAQSVKELIELARRSPGKLTYSSSGVGVITHLAGSAFADANGISMLHVPFKGGAPAIQAVASGDVDMTFGSPPSVLPMVQAGKLRLLAVTSAERSPLFPDLPGMKESGVNDYDLGIWYGLYGPAGLPADVTKKLFDASIEALNDPNLREQLDKQGNGAAPSASPADFRSWASKKGADYKRLTMQAGVTLQ
jgi:tripartite-type tricarboxylate transporter receptor subunit TctC